MQYIVFSMSYVAGGIMFMYYLRVRDRRESNAFTFITWATMGANIAINALHMIIDFSIKGSFAFALIAIIDALIVFLIPRTWGKRVEQEIKDD